MKFVARIVPNEAPRRENLIITYAENGNDEFSGRRFILIISATIAQSLLIPLMTRDEPGLAPLHIIEIE